MEDDELGYHTNVELRPLGTHHQGNCGSFPCNTEQNNFCIFECSMDPLVVAC